MFAWIWLIAAACLGIGLVRRLLGDVLRPLSQVAAGTAVGWILGAWLAYGVASWRGALEVDFLVAETAGLAIGALAVFWSGRKDSPLPHWPALERSDWQALAITALLSPIVIYLFATHWFAPR